jgi:hypothetical protein
MSRRLENIPTGFIDYGAAGRSLMEGIQMGRNIVLQEEERQRKLQELENQRASVANTIYRQNQADIERWGSDLSTSEKKAFSTQFDDVMKINRQMQDFILKGGKVNSDGYIALQDLMEKQKKNILMNVGALKEVKDTMSQLVTLQKSKYQGFDDDITVLQNAYNNIIAGKYVPSIDLPTKTSVTQKAYVAPSVVFESYVPKIAVVQQEHVVKDANKKIIRTEKKQIPSYTDLETLSYDSVNAPAVNSSGIMKEFMEFKNLNKDQVKPEYQSRYDLYKMYMKEVGKDAKAIKDFEAVDFSMMELIARRYKPAPDEAERFYKEPKGSSGSLSAKDAGIMDEMLTDIFSGDAKRAKAVIDKLTGALNSKGWKIGFNGKNVTAEKSPDEWDPAKTTYGFDLLDNDKNRATAKAMINAYFSAIGRAGRMTK